MDAPVLDELRQGETGDLAADRVEATDDDGLGRVVDDQVDAGGLLQGADVAPLTADDAALHLVRGQRHHGHGHLGRVVGHDALDGRDHDVARLVLGLVAGLALDGAGDAHGVILGLCPDRFEELRLGLLATHLADPLQGRDLLLLRPGELLAAGLELAFAVDELAVLGRNPETDSVRNGHGSVPFD